jgi:hypothetical protein
MKRIYLNIESIFVFLVLFSLVSCKKDTKNESFITKGYLSLFVNQNSIEEVKADHLKAALVNDFVVELYDKNAVLQKTYAKLSDVPTSIILDKGEYYFTAYSSNSTKAAFDNPCYFGQSSHVTIVGGDQKIAIVQCYLSNVKVCVVYSDTIKTSFYDYSVDVYNKTDTLHFIKDEIRKGYFNPGDLNIDAHLLYKNNNGITIDKILHGSIPSAKAMKEYQLRINASVIQGNSSISVTAIDSTTTEVIIIADNITNPPITPPTTKTMADLVAGNLLITEVMADPNAVADAAGEWFEIYNNATFPININGLIIQTASKTMTLTIDHVMQKGDYIVLGNTVQGISGALYYYGSALSLVNSSGSLQLLSNTTTVIAEMSYTSAPTGASLSLDPSKMSYLQAKDPTSWCTATTTFSTGDKGTPGLANTTCN